MNRGAATRGSFSHRLKVSVYLLSTCVWNTLTFWFHFEAPLLNCGTSMRDLSEISRGGRGGGNFKFGFGN